MMLVLTEGPFGLAVADKLKMYTASNVYRLTDVVDRLEMLVEDVDFVAVALWRPYDRECDRLDQICSELKIPWSSVCLIDEAIWAGPLVMPGVGPCYRCFRRRLLTHAIGANRDLSLMKAYMKNPDLGPAGFVAPMVGMAVFSLVTAAHARQEHAGRIRRIDLFEGSIVDAKVIAVHNCDRCRSQASDDRQMRFIEFLKPAIGEIWHETR